MKRTCKADKHGKSQPQQKPERSIRNPFWRKKPAIRSKNQGHLKPLETNIPMDTDKKHVLVNFKTVQYLQVIKKMEPLHRKMEETEQKIRCAEYDYMIGLSTFMKETASDKAMSIGLGTGSTEMIPNDCFRRNN